MFTLLIMDLISALLGPPTPDWCGVKVARLHLRAIN